MKLNEIMSLTWEVQQYMWTMCSMRFRVHHQQEPWKGYVQLTDQPQQKQQEQYEQKPLPVHVSSSQPIRKA